MFRILCVPLRMYVCIWKSPRWFYISFSIYIARTDDDDVKALYIYVSSPNDGCDGGDMKKKLDRIFVAFLVYHIFTFFFKYVYGCCCRGDVYFFFYQPS